MFHAQGPIGDGVANPVFEAVLSGPGMDAERVISGLWNVAARHRAALDVLGEPQMPPTPPLSPAAAVKFVALTRMLIAQQRLHHLAEQARRLGNEARAAAFDHAVTVVWEETEGLRGPAQPEGAPS
ncbi:hypothetical protein [Deinococcus multiflagellatus]|uniref:ANTAR domain-containing protein n=1 Tax=Deinococcus multiflagellatus TaxID=1656887 RepID=A0ABW1ZT75_9DEIO